MSGSATMASEPSSSSAKTLVSAPERKSSASKPLTHLKARKSTISLRTTLSRTSTLLKSNVPDLDELKLSHILNGETCPPISFPDFASFITHKEFSTENLLFVIWFRSYRARYEALGKDKTAGVPVPSTRLGDRYTPFKYLDKAIAEGIVGTAASNYTQSGSLDRLPSLSNEAPLASMPGKGDWKPCTWAAQPGQTLGVACGCDDPEGHNRRRSFFALGAQTHEKSSTASPAPENKGILHGTMHPPLPPPGTILLDTKEQPMRDEALRAFATFLQKGGSRELGIADELREFARVTLRRSCAPDCFLPIYDEVYSVIENQSLPHFLGYAKTNINRPKQLFWYWVGFADFMIGVLLYLLPTLFMRQTSYPYRLARLPSILFAVFGAMQFYSAWRGFCNQVWGRRSRQVRPWEMDEMVDEEAALRDDTAEEAFEPALETSLPYDSPTGGLEGGFFRDPFSFGAAGAAVDAKLADPSSQPPPMVERRGTFALPTMRNESLGAHSLELGPDEDVPLPEGVHPLTDLGGHSPPPGEIPWAISFPQPEAAAPVPVLEDELSPIALKQLQIRRATVKQPAAELAFPIFDPEAVPPSSSPVSAPMASARTASRGSISPIAPATLTMARNRSIITPFDADDPLTPFTEKSMPEADIAAAAAADPGSPSSSTKNKTTEELASDTTSDLSSLLRIFRRKEPLDKDAYRQSEETREGQVKVFGPEQLIVDPRVRKVMEGIVRDILVVGAIAGVVFSVLVFATPIAAVV